MRDEINQGDKNHDLNKKGIRVSINNKNLVCKEYVNIKSNNCIILPCFYNLYIKYITYFLGAESYVRY